jgi:hypothetical protein
MTRRSTIACLIPLALAAGCATHSSASKTAPTPAAAATPEQSAALIDRVKGLQGTWQASEGGKPGGEVTFAVTSNGSVVRETMFPGSQHEMTNMYHMDGPTLVMTHYCAIGNQPQMRATAAGPHDPIVLKFDRISNLSSPDQSYMGGLTLVFIDPNHIEERWTSYKGGKPEGEPSVFTFTRKQ